MVSRRDFLRISAFASIGWPHFWVNSSINNPLFFLTNSRTDILGRVLYDGTAIFSNPDEDSVLLKDQNFNDILPLSQPIKGSLKGSINEIWYRIRDGGYIHSKNIQLVRNILSEPHSVISNTGQLAEITVPFSKAWPKDKESAFPNQIFFYGSTHWVHGIGRDPEGKLYYLIIEDRWGDAYYVDATHMQIIGDYALVPNASEIEPDKKSILVDTKNQLLIAYKDENPAMISPISSGVVSDMVNLETPLGDYRVMYKRPSRHMVHSDKVGVNDRELYGVPWVTYFTDTGIGFHGTYWHNDYSHPHSHGCVNMPIQAARWLYLWSDPVVPPREKTYVSKYGTHVKVI
jgi:hypothetical protein